MTVPKLVQEASGINSDEEIDACYRAALAGNADWAEAEQHGDTAATIAAASRIIEAEYQSPLGRARSHGADECNSLRDRRRGDGVGAHPGHADDGGRARWCPQGAAREDHDPSHLSRRRLRPPTAG